MPHVAKLKETLDRLFGYVAYEQAASYTKASDIDNVCSTLTRLAGPLEFVDQESMANAVNVAQTRQATVLQERIATQQAEADEQGPQATAMTDANCLHIYVWVTTGYLGVWQLLPLLFRGAKERRRTASRTPQY
ncbi:hypothetical protein FZEAL_1783 [Fusarium zealandicum]|uniref:Uncharacterized protein n=1 Tax=Fusarium zealandicum TaxID=1053134 RepID=A0A8H4USU1_9HYPO|nr:hypothetical protein FZEAL_1783 [Fusarium zealandicum]